MDVQGQRVIDPSRKRWANQPTNDTLATFKRQCRIRPCTRHNQEPISGKQKESSIFYKKTALWKYSQPLKQDRPLPVTSQGRFERFWLFPHRILGWLLKENGRWFDAKLFHLRKSFVTLKYDKVWIPQSNEHPVKQYIQYASIFALEILRCRTPGTETSLIGTWNIRTECR